MKTHRTSGATRRLINGTLIILATTAAVIVFSFDGLLRPDFLARLELATIDYRFLLRGALPIDSSNVVIVEISEESFTSLPERFPWPRSYYARVLRNLHRAGARVVGLDIILGGNDPYAPANDDSLRTALSATGIAVLAGKREQDDPLVLRTVRTELFGNMFARSTPAVGLVNIRNDADGIYRSYPPMFAVQDAELQDRFVPTFAFAVLNTYLGFAPMTVPAVVQGGFEYAGRRIPAVDPSSFLVSYYAPSGSFPRVGFHDLVDDEGFTTTEERATGEQINTFSDPDFGLLQSGMLRGKIALVGVTIPEYKDLFPVSIARGRQKGDNLMYGVEIHANVIENVLRGDFLRSPPVWLDVLIILVCVSLSFVGVALPKGSSSASDLLMELASILAVVVLLGLLGTAAHILFTYADYVISVTGAAMAILTGYGASTTYHYVVERRQRAMIKNMFSTYLNPSLVDELVAHPERLVLGGRREELTVLFSDIEGFTTISQSLPPEDLVALLNEYLDEMSEVVFDNDGTVDKYEGDALMAFWGAPLPQKDHALRACTAALQMIQRLEQLNLRWAKEDKPFLNIRIGINTGPMVVGNMGSQRKFAYTVIGDSVNVASRLEGANREYRTRIMVTERTYRLVSEFIAGRLLDKITVRGRLEAVMVYELLYLRNGPVHPAVVQVLELYTEGMTLYQSQRWHEAREKFEQALVVLPDDHPSRIYMSRAAMYEKNPPPEWTGIFRPQ